MKTDMAALLHREIISVFAVEYIFALIQLVLRQHTGRKHNLN